MKPRLRLGFGFCLVGVAVFLSWRLSEPSNALRKKEPAHPAAQTAHQRHDLRGSDRRLPRTQDREAVNAAAQRWYEELLERYPQFQVEFKDVPDEENGFLQFLELMEEFGGSNAKLPMSDELRDMLSGDGSWNSVLVTDWMRPNEVLFARLLEIAEAPGQSVKGIDIERYIVVGAALARDIALVLQAAARLEIDGGSPDEALRLFKASANLANHFDGVEHPLLLSKTVSVLVRMENLANFRSTILPRIAGDRELLEQWRIALAHPESINTAAPRLFNGEWHATVRCFLLPGLLTSGSDLSRMPDPDAFLDAYAVAMSGTKKHVAGLSLADVTPGNTIPIQPPNHLSPLADEALAWDSLRFGASEWLRAFGRTLSQHAMHDATFAVLLGERLPLEPHTGMPFIWDEASRTILPPPEALELGLELEPIVVPDVDTVSGN